MDKSKNPGGGQKRGLAAYQQTLSKAGRGKPAEKDASENDGAAGGLLKTTKAREQAHTDTAGGPPSSTRESGQGIAKARAKPAVPAPAADESKFRRVAKFLILIGNKEAPAILAKLDKAHVEEISKEIVSIRGITAEEADAVLYEFRHLLAASYGFTGKAEGGIEAARQILHTAYGPEKGEALLRKAVPGALENPLSFLEEYTGEQTALLLRDETPASIALVLSRLSPQKSAAALANIRPDQKAGIVRRIARLGETSPEVLELAAAALREKARFIAASQEDADGIDGRSALTAILKHAGSDFGDMMLNKLENEDPELGRDLKERFNTLEDVMFAEDKPLEEKLRSMEDKEIVLLLKGKSKSFMEKIYSNLSSSRRAMVREEGEIMGAAAKRDVDAATSSFLDWFRQGREEGRILLLNDDDIVE